jgi:alkaline phosphatase D
MNNSYIDYKELVNITPIIGTWDDHDYGIGDGGSNFYYKDRNREIFLDFIGEPNNT